jgi:hypothetical protein
MGSYIMSPAKIIRIVGVALAVAAALIPNIPMAGLGLAILGLGAGWYVASGDRATLLVTVIALNSGVAGAVNAIPTVGPYVGGILDNLGSLLAAAAVTVVVMAVKEQLSE